MRKYVSQFLLVCFSPSNWQGQLDTTALHWPNGQRVTSDGTCLGPARAGARIAPADDAISAQRCDLPADMSASVLVSSLSESSAKSPPHLLCP